MVKKNNNQEFFIRKKPIPHKEICFSVILHFGTLLSKIGNMLFENNM